MTKHLGLKRGFCSRIASWRYQHIKCLPEIQQVHVQVGLYAFFHRLYGMYPCNFLSYLRQHYAENNKDNQLVFVHTIRPMLNTVRMHPLLVTHSRLSLTMGGCFSR